MLQRWTFTEFSYNQVRRIIQSASKSKKLLPGIRIAVEAFVKVHLTPKNVSILNKFSHCPEHSKQFFDLVKSLIFCEFFKSSGFSFKSE